LEFRLEVWIVNRPPRRVARQIFEQAPHDQHAIVFRQLKGCVQNLITAG